VGKEMRGKLESAAVTTNKERKQTNWATNEGGKGEGVRLCRVECFGSWLTLTHAPVSHSPSLSRSVPISLYLALALSFSIHLSTLTKINIYFLFVENYLRIFNF